MIRPTCIIWVYINKNTTNQISNNKIHHQSLFLSNAKLKKKLKYFTEDTKFKHRYPAQQALACSK